MSKDKTEKTNAMRLLDAKRRSIKNIFFPYKTR